jgi:signal transduction histidine kinase
VASMEERSAPLSQSNWQWSGPVELCALAVIGCIGLVVLGVLLGAIATAPNPGAATGVPALAWTFGSFAAITSGLIGVIGVRLIQVAKKHMAPSHRAGVADALDLASQLEAARKAERLKIARDLHDALGSTLIALRLELAGSGGANELRPGVRVRQPRASLELVDSALETVKNLIAELRPAPIERFGLWEAIEWQANQFSARLGIPCRFSQSANLPEPKGELAVAIYRIVEEALTNVARHAAAKNVEVTCQQRGDELEIIVRDDGCGIAAEQPRRATTFGLIGMNERGRTIGGTVSIANNAPIGTAVCLRIPLENIHESAAA